MQTLEIKTTGQLQEKDISRKDLIHIFHIHQRDLRPVFSSRQSATIARRGDCLIVNLRKVRMVVGEDRVFLFNISDPQVIEKLVPQLVKSLQKQEELLPFCFDILEGALEFTFQRIQHQFEELAHVGERILKRLALEKEPRDDIFAQLLSLKKQLSRVEMNATELEELLIDILKDDEELQDFYFSKKVRNTEEIESILENTLEQIEDIADRAHHLSENIDDTQEVLTLKMDQTRNIIIRFNLLIASTAVIFAFLAVIVGLFGMNIRNALEESHSAFIFMTITLVAAAVLFGLMLWGYLKKKRIL